MLSLIHAHAGSPPAPHDVWAAWAFEPLVVAGLAAGWWLYRRGARGRRSATFLAGLVVVAVALLSPLDAAAEALAAAHMVQHVLLILVAAPLLVASRAAERVWRGLPVRWRRWWGRRRRAAGLTPARVHALRSPAVAWLLHVAAIWFWHAAGPYEAALSSDLLHIAQHGSFLLTAMLFWSVVLETRPALAVGRGAAIMLLFTMALQGTILSALLTFSAQPWYTAYAETTAVWGMTPLADQQLAGVLMWVPGGLVYAGAALALLAAWLRELDAASAIARCVR